MYKHSFKDNFNTIFSRLFFDSPPAPFKFSIFILVVRVTMAKHVMLPGRVRRTKLFILLFIHLAKLQCIMKMLSNFFKIKIQRWGMESKNIFLGCLNFWCLLYSLMGYCLQCVFFSVYCVNHRLSVRVRRDAGVYHLAVYDLGGFQIVLGVQSLERLENLKISHLCFYL